MSAGASAYGTVPDVRSGTQGDAAAFAMRFDEGAPVAVIDVAGGPGGIAGFRPSDRISDVPTSRNASRHEAERTVAAAPGPRRRGGKLTTAPTDVGPVEQLQMMRFKGEKWDLFGDIINGELSN